MVACLCPAHAVVSKPKLWVPHRSVQTFNSPDCAAGTGTVNPFAPSLDQGKADGEAHPQSATIAFGVCFKDLRVDNMNDDPDTAHTRGKVGTHIPRPNESKS